MSVFNRLSDIVNANLNAMLDQAEDPQKVVRLITQEMQDTLVEIRSTSARYLADKRGLVSQIDKVRQEAHTWEQKAELAIAKGRDDLAKAALREKSIVEEVLTRLEADLNHCEIAITRLQADTSALEEKLKQARVREKALILRGETAKSRMKVKRQINNVSFEDALARFDSYERRLDEMEGEVEAFDLGNVTLAAEIDGLQDDQEVEQALLALKQKCGADNTTTSQ